MKRVATEEIQKEGDEKRVATTGERLKGVAKKQYERLVQAVEAAMVADTKQPIVLEVQDRSRNNRDRYHDYSLTLVPSDRAAALHLLQRLMVTNGEEHAKLTRALYAYDGNHDSTDDASEDENKEAQECLLRECGVSSVGSIDMYPNNDDHLSPFLYRLLCVVDFTGRIKKAEEDDESDLSL